MSEERDRAPDSASAGASPLRETFASLIHPPRHGMRLQPLFDELFAAGLYQQSLAARAPRAPRQALSPLLPGDAARGEALLAGRFEHAGETEEFATAPWLNLGAPPAWLAAAHGFAWLDDLAAVGAPAAAPARALTLDWIGRFGGYDPLAWRADILAGRLIAWLTQLGLLLDDADETETRRILRSAARQARHLARVHGLALGGAARLRALAALALAGLALSGFRRTGARAQRRLIAALEHQMLPDGGHVSRSPAAQLAALADAIRVTRALQEAGEAAPTELLSAADRAIAALQLVRHPDGKLALFNGTGASRVDEIEAVLAAAHARPRPPVQAPHWGFQRLSAGELTVIVDTGGPPPRGEDHGAHAGTLSFEASIGRQRVIVNCGGVAAGPLADMLRATAAHSTVTVDDRNSSELLGDGTIGRRPNAVTCLRDEADGAVWVDASHDGYGPLCGIAHRRRLYLAAGGTDLRGEDTLAGRAGHAYAVRFHLHPDVSVSLQQTGNSALLRLPGKGGAWRFRAAGGKLALEPSVYAGEGRARRSEQLVIAGTTVATTTQIKWVLAPLEG